MFLVEWLVLGSLRADCQAGESLSTGLNTGWQHAAKITVLQTEPGPEAQEGREAEDTPPVVLFLAAGGSMSSRTSLVSMGGWEGLEANVLV